MSSLDLDSSAHRPVLSRINRVPIVIMVALSLIFFGVIIWGLAGRGIGGRGGEAGHVTGQPTSDLADAITQGVRPGIVQAPAEAEREPPGSNVSLLPTPTNPFMIETTAAPSLDISQIDQPQRDASEVGWQERLERELAEARLREEHRQQLAAIQADHTAASSPLQIDLSRIQERQDTPSGANMDAEQTFGATGAIDRDAFDLISGAGRNARWREMSHLLPQGLGPRDPDGVTSAFTPTRSRYALKRGAVIPATLISAINSDLPGPITAQVGQNVFDSATGHYLLIPQGSKLVGRYQSDAGFGQRRVFVVWSDIVFPNGATLQMGQLSGVDVGGRAGFSDRVDNRYLERFGTAALVALIGTGLDLASPRPDAASLSAPWEAGRANLGQSLGEVAQQSISRGLDIAPTLEIRSGYRFNVFVEHDIAFPGPYISDREALTGR